MTSALASSTWYLGRITFVNVRYLRIGVNFLLTFFIKALGSLLNIALVLLIFHLLHLTLLALAQFHSVHRLDFDDDEFCAWCDTQFFESFWVMIRWNEAILDVLPFVLNLYDARLPTATHEQIPSFGSRPQRRLKYIFWVHLEILLKTEWTTFNFNWDIQINFKSDCNILEIFDRSIIILVGEWNPEHRGHFLSFGPSLELDSKRLVLSLFEKKHLRAFQTLFLENYFFQALCFGFWINFEHKGLIIFIWIEECSIIALIRANVLIMVLLAPVITDGSRVIRPVHGIGVNLVRIL